MSKLLKNTHLFDEIYRRKARDLNILNGNRICGFEMEEKSWGGFDIRNDVDFGGSAAIAVGQVQILPNKIRAKVKGVGELTELIEG